MTIVLVRSSLSSIIEHHFLRDILFIDLVIYDWFERENSEREKYHGHQYKLGLTKQQYNQMKTLVSPMGTLVN